MSVEFDINELEKLIEYQNGSVVSKTLIKKDTGTVTVFAFDKDQGLSEHTAPFDALVNILDGKGDVTIAGTTKTLKKGEMVIMPANKPHALRTNDRFKMMLVMIK